MYKWGCLPVYLWLPGCQPDGKCRWPLSDKPNHGVRPRGPIRIGAVETQIFTNGCAGAHMLGPRETHFWSVQVPPATSVCASPTHWSTLTWLRILKAFVSTLPNSCDHYFIDLPEIYSTSNRIHWPSRQLRNSWCWFVFFSWGWNKKNEQKVWVEE